MGVERTMNSRRGLACLWAAHLAATGALQLVVPLPCHRGVVTRART